MTPSIGLRLLTVLLACIGMLCLPAIAADGVLVLGRVSDNPQEHYNQLKPLLDYVVPRMRDVGITEGRILMARDAQQMQSYLRRGRVDWVTETPAMSAILEDRAGARRLLLTEREGVSAYRSVFFARRDSGITSLADLRGRSLAMQNNASTSSYFVPVMELLETGVPMELLLSPLDTPASDEIGYLFAGSELNVSTWVHKRLVSAGVFSNLDWQNLKRMPAGFRDAFTIIHQSAPFPRALEMVRGDLDPAVERRLREVLLGAALDPDAREALLHFFRTTRFMEIDADTAAALDNIRAGTRRVRMDIE